MAQDYATVTKYGVIALGIVAGLYLLSKAEKVVTASADLVGGVATGNNAATLSARTDAYQGKGIFGTLGAAADNTSGGALSTVGEWLGGKAADLVEYWKK